MPKQFLQVDGTKICYKVEGKGPNIFLVPRANGSEDLFIQLRSILIKYFTVAIYYRCGYCNSELSGPQDYTKKLKNNVEGIYTLSTSITIENLIIFAISSSDAVLMRYLIKYPDSILKIFLHEPLMNINALPEKERLQKIYNSGYRLYREKGKRVAIEKLFKRYFCEGGHIELEKVEAQKDKLVLLHSVE
ncbi:hypothetical protein INT48_008347 [Thamnidium elegans]|uniref:Uncharacterized protein n=1 Tax=Thamnidium elegans TaxID=101142 RepID=A0A8H7SU50_9FUNG|nr:hypothetical protein INT48_008347 [Thamnidium elegans]